MLRLDKKSTQLMISPFRTIILFFLFSIIGLGLTPRLSLQLDVQAQASSLSVFFSLPNAAPAIIENRVITPLEGAFQLIDGIKSTYAVASVGNGRIEISPKKGIDIDFLRFELNAKIRQLYPSLPHNLSFPIIRVFQAEAKVEDRPILTYTLSANEDPSVLYTYAREVLLPRLAMEQGLRSMEITGATAKEWRITYDQARLQSLQLSKTDLLTAIQPVLERKPIGAVQTADNRIYIKLQANQDLSLQQQLEEVHLSKIGQQVVLLKEVAMVEWVERPLLRHYRINGANSLNLLFFADPGANVIQVASRLRAEVDRLAKQTPDNYRLRLDNDASVYLSKEIRKIIQRTGLSLLILLVFVLLIYQSGIYLIILLMALLANLGIAVIFYEWMEVDLHLYALAGITVSFGIVIDNSIVMMHHFQNKGNRSVFAALLASTLTTIASLTIIWFLPVQWQVNLADFAKVLAINLGVSLLVAWALIPALLRYFRKNAPPPAFSLSRARRVLGWQRRYAFVITWLMKKRIAVIIGLILLFGLPVFMLPNHLKEQEWYNRSLGSDYYVEHIKPLVNRALGGTLRLFMWYVYEGAQFRQVEETVLYVDAQMPPGASLDQMNAVFLQLEGYLGQYDQEVKRFVSQVRSGERANMSIYFSAGYDQSFPHLLKARLQAFGSNLGGIEWNIYGVGRAFSNAGGGTPPSFKVKLKGYNKVMLEQQAERFAELLLEHPRIQEVNTEANIEWYARDRYEYILEMDKEALSQTGLGPLDIFRDLSSFDQSYRDDAQLPNGSSLRLVAKEQKEQDLWRLQNQLRPVDSSQLAFQYFGRLIKRKVAASIHKEDQQYLRMISFEYLGSGQFGSRYLDQVIEQMNLEMPLGYSLERQSYQFGSEKKKQYQLLLLVLALIFAICAIMFESFRQAALIISLIPISYVGIFLTFYWFDFPFDQGGYTSFILLSGIVVNSLILLVNDYNHLKRQWPRRSSIEIYLKAFRQKMTPILLTIISTILGMIPFVMHGQEEVFWFSLAVGTMGGLTFSMLVILFVIPVFFVRKEKL